MKLRLSNICFYRSCSKWVDLKENDYKIAEFFETEAEDPKSAESVRQKMFLHFATQENLPHRVAYDNKEFYFVSMSVLEKKYMGISVEPKVDKTSEVEEKPEQISEADAKPEQQVEEVKSKPEPVVKINENPVLMSQ